MTGQAATRQVVVTHRAGLHARPCLAIVACVSRFASKVTIRHGDQQVEADDILQVMSLGVPEGAEITLSARGVDADEALDALATLFAQNFGFDD